MTIELRVLCEGQTEQGFVTQALAPHLKPFGVYPRAEPLNRGRFGGVSFNTLYRAIKRDVGRSRQHQYVTTMIDLYGLSGFPGSESIPGERVLDRVARIEGRMRVELPNLRFVPYIQVHEFEAIVFVDLDALPSQFPDGEATGAPLQLRQDVGETAPEEIDDGLETAPSKRLIHAIPQYEHLKPIVGPAIASKITLSRIRAACPHFHEWLSRLESLTASDRG